jgi:hypothetical protein
MRQPKKVDDAAEGQENMPPPGYNAWGKPIYPKNKTKSRSSIFQNESNFDMANRDRKKNMEKDGDPWF